MIEEQDCLQVVIVNWNAGIQLHDCLSSIELYGYKLVSSVVVVDNDSQDCSVNQLEDIFDLPLQVIRNNANLGFAVACNQGASLGETPYILFLNPDTRLFKNSLETALSVFKEPDNSNVGIVGVQLVDDVGVVSRSCARFPSLIDYVAQALGLVNLTKISSIGVHLHAWAHDETREVDHVMGAFYLVRRDLFKRLKGFDEQFFVYLEDLDFSLRASREGYRTIYLAESQAFHAGGGTSRQVKARRLFYSLRSRIIYGFKHFSTHKAWALVWLTAFIEPVTRIGYVLLMRDWVGVKNTIKSYCMLFGDMPSILKIRHQIANSKVHAK